MRIIAGSLRGKTIAAPDGEGTRPTIDRVREALFSSLYSLRGGFEGAIVLDAFAGSGALGIEALSRGARQAVFFERDFRAVEVLKGNLAACKLPAGAARVVRRDVLQAPPASHVPAFDLVFLDPPYTYDPADVLVLVSSLAAAGSLADGAIIVYEHAIAARDALSAAVEEAGFEVRVEKKYGKTGIVILTWDA